VTTAVSAAIVIGDPALRESVAAGLRLAGAEILFAVATPEEIRTSPASRPDVLVLDFGKPAAYATMAELKLLDEPPIVIAAHTSGDPDIILGALRAGVREFLYPPLNQERLRHALDAAMAERLDRHARQRAGAAIGFLSASGGCGATMLACHTAAELRRLGGGGTLLADLDVVAGTAALWMRASSSYSVIDVAANLARLDRSYWNGVVSQPQPGLDVLAAPPDIPTGPLPAPHRFADVLRFARTIYPWVVADLGSGCSPIALETLTELDTVYLVTTGEVTPLYQVKRILRVLLDSGYSRERLKLVLVRVRKDQPLAAPDIERLVGLPVAATLPVDLKEVSEAQGDGRLVSPKCDLGRRMLAFAGRLAGRPDPEQRVSKFSLLRFRAQEA
jgi:pilus assembly protein CpaE